MKKILFFLVLFLTVFSFGQISNGVSPVFPRIKSSISVPVRIPLAEISKMANTSVKDLIFEDNSYSDNNNDQFKIKVWRTKPIRFVSGTKQNLLIEVPLKIWAEKGVGTLGVYSYQETTFETVMYFNTSMEFMNNWTIATTTQPNGFKWVSKPVLDYGRIKIPISTLVEKSLKEEQLKFCKTIDDQLKSQLNFQPTALLAWNAFSQPIQVSDAFNTWLKISPVNVNASPLQFYKDAIDVTFSIDAFSETFTGSRPESSQPITRVPNFNFIPNLNSNFVLQTTANIPFSEATRLAQEMFLNKEFDFREGKSKVKVIGMEVSGKNNEIQIEIDTEGAIKGKSLITGIPVYDLAKRKIVLSKTHFKLKTANVLHKTASLLFQGKIVRMIQDEYGIPTAELEDFSKKSTEEAFNKEYYKGVKLSGKVNSMKPGSILVGQNGLTVVVDMQAQLRVLVQGF